MKSGTKEFFKEASENKNFGAAVLSLVLAIAYFFVTAGLSMIGGGFLIAIAVISCIAGVVSLVFFFVALADIFEKVT